MSEHGQAQFKTAEDARRYILGGRGIITTRSLKTGTHFTYKFKLSKDKQVCFVSVLGGRDNTVDYRYIGTIWIGHSAAGYQDFRWSNKSRIGVNAPSVQAFAWVWRKLIAGRIPANLEIFHEGRCGRCGRLLTTPESVERGFGPECAGILGIAPSLAHAV